ncbi:hypothetical protein JCM5350_008359 [Sporobolomyces pararoseus]
MSTFSPRQRPRTVNLNGFEDPDLTDQFRDDTLQSQASSNSRRHPRGDTPSRTGPLGTGTGTGTSASSTRLMMMNDKGTSLTNLDKLLDFLDNDDQHASFRGITKTPDRGRGGGEGGGSSTIRNPNFTSSATTTTIRTAETEKLQQDGSSPYSPSPRPGSVAAMRSHSRSLSFQSQNTLTNQRNLYNDDNDDSVDNSQHYQQQEEHEKGSVDSITRVAQAALDEFDSIISSSRGGGTAISTSSSSTKQQQSGCRSPHSESTRSPPVRQIPPSSHSNIDNFYPVPQPCPLPRSTSVSTSIQQRADMEEAEEPVEEITNFADDPHQLNLQLIQELRESQDYISFLQTELKTIGKVVSQLREHEKNSSSMVIPPTTTTITKEGSRGQSYLGGGRGEIGDHDQEEKLNENRRDKEEDVEVDSEINMKDLLRDENRKAFEIVQHLIAMIPSTTRTSTTEQGGGKVISIESINSSLNFVRKIDTLVMTSQQQGRLFGRDGEGMVDLVRRRDEEVFEGRNLERLEEIVQERLFQIG